jgi:hypothetical protein
MTKYKILMHGSVMVNGAMLSKGIYAANTPTLHPHDTTIESLLVGVRAVFNHFVTASHGQDLDKYEENLKKCELIDFVLMKAESADPEERLP